MKILYIAQSCDPYNGSEDQIGWQIPWEAARTHQVFVVTRPEKQEPIERFLKTNEKRNISVYYVDVPLIYKKMFKGSFYSMRLLKWNKNAFPLVEEICKKEHIEIVHQITPIEFRSMGDYGRIPEIKYICGPIAGGQRIDPCLLCYVRGKHRIIEWLRERINQVFRLFLLVDGRMKRCNWLLLANRETYQFLGAGSFGVHTSFLADVGIDSSVLSKADPIKEPHSEVRFLVPARLVYLKGHDFLLDVLEKLPRELNYVCRIVGGGPLFSHLCQRCESPGLKGKVQVVGSVDYMDMEREYQWADALLFPSFREATGMVTLEAMANAIPVITVNRFGAAILLDKDSGCFFEGDSAEAYQESLKQVLLDCIQNPEKLKNKGKIARKMAMAYTWEEKMKFYQNIYSDLLKNGGA